MKRNFFSRFVTFANFAILYFIYNATLLGLEKQWKGMMGWVVAAGASLFLSKATDMTYKISRHRDELMKEVSNLENQVISLKYRTKK